MNNEAEWLDIRGVWGPDALNLLRPYPDEELEAVPVSTRLNSPVNDDAGCLTPWGTIENRRTKLG